MRRQTMSGLGPAGGPGFGPRRIFSNAGEGYKGRYCRNQRIRWLSAPIAAHQIYLSVRSSVSASAGTILYGSEPSSFQRDR